MRTRFSIDDVTADDGRGALAHHLAASFTHPERDLAPVHDAVRTFAVHARRSGLAPEKMLAMLKQLVVEAATSRAPYRRCNEMTDRVVAWAIEEYFDESSPPVRGVATRSRETPGQTSLQLPG